MAATTMQLEFEQAMSDFKTMFPDMEVEVIEVILRSNKGAVDATIDQLLAMSTDNQVSEPLVIFMSSHLKNFVFVLCIIHRTKNYATKWTTEEGGQVEVLKETAAQIHTKCPRRQLMRHKQNLEADRSPIPC